MTDRADPILGGDGIDRRGFLKCMAWAGTGVLWTLTGGVLSARTFDQLAGPGAQETPDGLHFAQISDSHIGFHKEANPDVVATFQTAMAKLNALPAPPSFLIHTGDISHMSKPEEFDTVDQILKDAVMNQVYYVPGEHDVIGENGKLYREQYGKGTQGDGWYSFDQDGVHFLGLVNVVNFQGGMGRLGKEQLAWIEQDVRPLRSSTPIVVFAHIPLWSVYPGWGWGTADSAKALSFLKRFGSVTVLNGHIHQTMQKVEGHITFHTAASTAFPQPKPGAVSGPGPLRVPADRLRRLLGVTSVNYVEGKGSLAVVDIPLESPAAPDADR
jgi:3',5'-cyclic AMP phosphodiesterase CpdA